jgi:hypothetical protein
MTAPPRPGETTGPPSQRFEATAGPLESLLELSHCYGSKPEFALAADGAWVHDG